MNKDWLLALSGGADSVALLLMLKEKGYANLHALHCNFHLRGEESDRDEQFCRDLCQKLSIDFHVKHFDTRTEAAKHHESIEMSARRLRYEWFRTMQQQLHAEGIFVAHHQDDQAETVLMNLLRGTGAKGLMGMSPDSIHDGLRIIRPLLGMSKKEILDYLQLHHQDFVTDSTNLERDALRNRIRLDLIPLLRQLNPQATECISRTAENLRMEAENHAESELFERLSPLGFSREQILDIHRHLSTHATGLTWYSQTHTVYINRGDMSIVENNGEADIPELKIEEIPSDAKLSFSQDCAYIDAHTIHGKLRVRHYTAGERFQPFGMNGKSRLISDYLTDRKVSLQQKKSQLVVCDDDSIVWLVGQTTDHRHIVTPETRQIFRITTELPL